MTYECDDENLVAALWLMFGTLRYGNFDENKRFIEYACEKLEDVVGAGTLAHGNRNRLDFLLHHAELGEPLFRLVLWGLYTIHFKLDERELESELAPWLKANKE